MRDERLKSQRGVVAPIGPAVALPPGAADGIGAHAEPHAELKDPRKGAGGRKAHDQSLKNTEPGIGLHDTNQTQNGIGSHETVGVERHREIVLAAPTLAEITDVTGLEACIDRAAPVGDPYPVAPSRGQRRETSLLLACNVSITCVAQHIEMETAAATGSVQTRQHWFEIADHPLRRFVADAQQDRGRRRHRLVATDTRRHRHNRRNRVDR